jgi:GAF domain-containing protein
MADSLRHGDAIADDGQTILSAVLRVLVGAVAIAGLVLASLAFAGQLHGQGAIPPMPLVSGLLLGSGSLMSLLSLVLVVRGWRDSQARWLAVGCLWFVLGDAVPVAVRDGWAYAGVVGTVTDVLAVIGMAALVLFSVGWHATPPAFARGARSLALLLAGIGIVGSSVADQVATAPRAFQAVGLLAFSVMVCASIAGLAVSAFNARGLERRRIGWICVTSAVGYAPLFLFIFLRGSGHHSLAVVSALMCYVVPFGYGYAILRDRVIDLGFALNRAAVFAATTALLVGLFGALQWGADQLLVRATGAQNFAVQMVIAVFVLYVVRMVRVRTESLVTHLFFAARLRRIDAIRGFAREVDAVENAETIAGFVIDRLRFACTIEASLYVESSEGFVREAGSIGPAHLSVDAPLVIALRAAIGPISTVAYDDIGAGVVFPLVVRAQLRGGLVCSFPAGDDAFAPDESEALVALATRTAIARDDLLAQSLRAENRELLARVHALERETQVLARLMGLPEATSAE